MHARVMHTGVSPGPLACAPHDNVETPLAGVLYTGVMPGRRVCARLACLRHAYGRQTRGVVYAYVILARVRPGPLVCGLPGGLRHAYGRQTGASCVRASSRRATWSPARL